MQTTQKNKASKKFQNDDLREQNKICDERLKGQRLMAIKHMKRCATLLIICMLTCSAASDSLRLHGMQPTRLLCPWNFPGRNTGVRCPFLLQGIFPTQGTNPRLLLAGGFFTTEPPGKPIFIPRA